MCGIAVAFSLNAATLLPLGKMEAALKCIAHRGPDHESIHAKGSAVLGHRRLSVLDTSPAGHQPFTDNAGRYTMVFNGEIFNFRELRTALEKIGESFRSNTDTEVILRSYILNGPKFLHDLNGFFALAIHDAENDSLFIARDRFGIKPLYWSNANNRFCAASELRALSELDMIGTIDSASLTQFLTYHYIPAPFTAFKGCHKLLPGHSISVDRNGVKVNKWYDLVEHAKSFRSGPDKVKQLFELMNDSVRLRLISDVPVGAFLSGGVDSSIVSAIAAKHHPKLHTFSIGFADDPYFDETRYAEEVAQHIGTEHHTFNLTTEELAENYSRLLDALDEPFADSSALPSFILCERTRKHVTVALSGDGADELFGGYRKHQAELRWQTPAAAEIAVRTLAPLWASLPRSRNSAIQDKIRQFDRFARLSKSTQEQRFLNLASFTPKDIAESLTLARTDNAIIIERERMITAPITKMPGLNGMLLADVTTTLPNDMLNKVDITSMAHALEVRTPFLDKRMVEFAFALPAEAKIKRGSGKYILRDTFGHLLPDNVMTRSKKGFEVPLLSLFKGPLRSMMNETLSSSNLKAAGFDAQVVKNVIQQMNSSDPAHSQATVHALLVYIAWWKRAYN